MEDLALVVSAIFFGLIILGAGSVVLAVLARRGKLSNYWPIAAAVILLILGVVAWQGLDRLGMIPIGWALLTALITFWPNSKKPV
jgi:hypothetical protein